MEKVHLLPSQDTIITWIKEGNVKKIKELLDSDFDFFDEDYHVRISAQEGQTEIFSLILEKGYEINYRNYLVCREAIDCGQLDFLKFCFNYLKKEVVHFKFQARDWMFLAIERKQYHIVDYFISQQIYINNDFLERSMEIDSLPIFELLFQHWQSNLFTRLALIKTMNLAEHLPYLSFMLQQNKVDLNNLSPLLKCTHPDLITYLYSYKQSLDSYHKLNQTLTSQENTIQPKI